MFLDILYLEVSSVAVLVCNYSSQFRHGKKICKFLFLGTKLNQVSSSLKKIKLLLCWRALMRTESADSDKWQ